MRSDLFTSKKCIHVKLSKDVHTGLRSKLLERGMSMQEVFDEVARLVAVGDKRLEKILDEYARKKLQSEIDRLSAPRKPQVRMDELDKDALYDLINTEGHRP